MLHAACAARRGGPWRRRRMSASRFHTSIRSADHTPPTSSSSPADSPLCPLEPCPQWCSGRMAGEQVTCGATRGLIRAGDGEGRAAASLASPHPDSSTLSGSCSPCNLSSGRSTPLLGVSGSASVSALSSWGHRAIQHFCRTLVRAGLSFEPHAKEFGEQGAAPIRRRHNPRHPQPLGHTLQGCRGRRPLRPPTRHLGPRRRFPDPQQQLLPPSHLQPQRPPQSLRADTRARQSHPRSLWWAGRGKARPRRFPAKDPPRYSPTRPQPGRTAPCAAAPAMCSL